MSSQEPQQEALRSRLTNFYHRALTKGEPLHTKHAVTFIEGLVLQSEPAQTMQRLMSSPQGLVVLKSALTAKTTLDFLNGQATSLLVYLQDPSLKLIQGGEFLGQVLWHVVDPPFLWDSFVDAFRASSLSNMAISAFAWLLLELICLPTETKYKFHQLAREPAILKLLQEAEERGVACQYRKIKFVVDATLQHREGLVVEGAGWRHDNDKEDFREITILPTPGELECSEKPFLRRSADILEVDDSSRFASHLDNQFRLLREDMMRELREELHLIQTGRSRGRSSLFVTGLALSDIKISTRQPWSLEFSCQQGLPGISKLPLEDRDAFIRDNRTRFLRHESLCCIMADQSPVTLAYIDRDEGKLALKTPVICLKFDADTNVKKTLLDLKKSSNISLVQLNTATFAYTPILQQLQRISWLSLGDEIVQSNRASSVEDPLNRIIHFVAELEANNRQDLAGPLNLPKPTVLDASQMTCLIAALKQKISLIQGPPGIFIVRLERAELIAAGTGKSFIGALIAKAIYLYTNHQILVICYTNHALDQFLEDLRDVGIEDRDMVRIGAIAKTSPSLLPISLKSQLQSMSNRSLNYSLLDQKRAQVEEQNRILSDRFRSYNKKKLSSRELKDQAEMDLDHPEFCGAFDIPPANDDMQIVDKKGRPINEFYLFERWCGGRDGGIFPEVVSNYPLVWKMKTNERVAAYTRWKNELREERAASVADLATAVNRKVEETNDIFQEKTRDLLKGKRIIGCTTTSAAKWVKQIQASEPAIVLVEEAGEIHEAHVLTALSPNTLQLVLIGDHQQLRPKVHYDLSVAKGEGYDLDVSMFERLVLKGYPHQTLSNQHRMRPEISKLVRKLTYHGLCDADSTLNRAHIRGLQSDLVFINHSEPEDDVSTVRDVRDPTTGTSKQNTFEAQMTLKCVKYLGQQGYGTDELVILTPYLAQLRLLLDVLAKENDPVLNDLDSHDLVSAGLMPAHVANQNKRRLRISSIDNYQGEQSDVVIISLTRSNPRCDIGFLTSPERLNVLLSRAKDGMILIGNIETFLGSRRGHILWKKLFDVLTESNAFFDGLPVVCAQHSDRKRILSIPEDFDTYCRDGGCDKSCGSSLSCGHSCPYNCHQISDHSNMRCHMALQDKCTAGHHLSWKCYEMKPTKCKACERRQKQQDKLADQARRAQEQKDEHTNRIAMIEDEIRSIRENNTMNERAQEMRAALEQKQLDLEQEKEQAKKTAARRKAAEVSRSSQQVDNLKSAPRKDNESEDHKDVPVIEPTSAEAEWARQKRDENAENGALDALMKMTGLSKVKEKFLNIKARVETAERQKVSLKGERFGIVLLGNPGTGKTTVARLYAKLLTSLDVLPGSHFEETTGARLANDGVTAAQKLLETIKNAGGGALFIDEAYQLASGNSFGGGAVLDFLLAEIENLTGVVVFILAGYNKQMEKFFEHNQGFQSRMPYSLQFEDYEDNELLLMFSRKVKSKYKDNMKIDGGLHGLNSRIAVRRLGRGRGNEGFGNARALENLLGQIAERQTDRLQKERTAGRTPDDFFMTREDLIGPQPSTAILQSRAWTELHKLIGLEMVKQSVQGLLSRLSTNYHRELKEKPIIEVSLNRVFLGSPGTGKTSVAKIYGRILKDIGCLSNGEVVVKNPSDFVGSVLGESEKNTKAILESTKGKVLVIDEAYMLHSNNEAGQNTSDPYKTAVVDALVAEIQSTPGEDRCVLLLGYREQMEGMFKATNPGLARRFPLDDAFEFQDFTEEELSQIFDLKLKQQGISATNEGKKIALGILSKARRRMNFGNGGEVENLITKAKNNYETRYKGVSPSERPYDMVFEPIDFDRDYQRSDNALINCRVLFKDMIGYEDTILKLEGYTRTAINMQAKGLDPASVIPFNFIFKGPPGTGKTTTARKIGQVFYNIGLLTSNDVVECSASDLIGQYIGQTGPKTIKQLERGLGRVLFIDEAYRFSEGHFATEAINELVDSLTKPKFHGKMIVILAGYEEAMNKLLQVNQGLGSRFPEEIIFKNMATEDCLTLLHSSLEASGIEVETREMSLHKSNVLALFNDLARLRSWGNGRDVITFAKSLVSRVFRDSDTDVAQFAVSYEIIFDALTEFYKTRSAREDFPPVTLRNEHGGSHSTPRTATREPLPIRQVSKSKVTTSKSPVEAAGQVSCASEPPPAATEQSSVSIARDSGVTDEVWEQLQKDRIAAENRKIEQEAQIAKLEKKYQKAAEEEARLASEQAKAAEARRIQATLEQKQKEDEAKRRHELARLARIKYLRERQAVEEQQRREAKAQEKLRYMGQCPVGFQWIRQAGGYRCAGGGHFVTDAQLNL